MQLLKHMKANLKALRIIGMYVLPLHCLEFQGTYIIRVTFTHPVYHTLIQR